MTLSLGGKNGLDRLPDVIIFDLDDTLYGYPIPHEAGLKAVETKLAVTLDVAEQTFRKGFDAARAKVKERLGNTASSHSRLLYFQQMLEDFGLRTQPLLSLDLEQTYWRTFLDSAQLFPKAEETLMELQSRGVRVGIVTDLTTQIQFRKILHLGIDRYIDFIVTSEEAGEDKVGRVPFKLAGEKFAITGDMMVWAVGDQLPDLEGARDVFGALTIQKVNSSVARYPADASFSNYSDLLQHIQKIG